MSSAHSPIFPSLHLHHSSFSSPSLSLPTSQLILQPFRCFTYVTAHSPTLLLPLLRHRFSLTSPSELPMTLTLLIPPPDRIINYAPGSSYVARRSSSRVSATSFALLSSVDVLNLPGLGSFLCSHNHYEND